MKFLFQYYFPREIKCRFLFERFDDNNNIVVQELAVNNYGFQGWTIEEILTDVMGMTSVHSKLFSINFCSGNALLAYTFPLRLT